VVKSPFPWFGGKSKVAELVWDYLGDVPNYCEPFFGSGAVLLGRPSEPGTETINDLDCMVANFWRALQHDPEAVAYHAENPVNEADQHARHLWLCSQEDFRETMKVDPEFYDTKIAGWWVWGQCIWIGGGWCAKQLPHLGDAGKGIHRKLTPLLAYMQELAERLKRVRVCCGDWNRILGPSVTFKHGITGVFLDPPYSDLAKRTDNVYSCDSNAVAHLVREWAIANGDNPDLRIALCGYEGEHVMPDAWSCIRWKAQGGYGSLRDNQGRENATKERIWFSPHCLGKQNVFDFVLRGQW
jgi:hypothetical protein